MSITRIDPATYERILTSAVAQYLDLGMDLKAARSMAKDSMDRAFVRDDMLFAAEMQRDDDDERDGDWTR